MWTANRFRKIKYQQTHALTYRKTSDVFLLYSKTRVQLQLDNEDRFRSNKVIAKKINCGLR